MNAAKVDTTQACAQRADAPKFGSEHAQGPGVETPGPRLAKVQNRWLHAGRRDELRLPHVLY